MARLREAKEREERKERRSKQIVRADITEEKKMSSLNWLIQLVGQGLGQGNPNKLIYIHTYKGQGKLQYSRKNFSDADPERHQAHVAAWIPRFAPALEDADLVTDLQPVKVPRAAAVWVDLEGNVELPLSLRAH